MQTAFASPATGTAIRSTRFERLYSAIEDAFNADGRSVLYHPELGYPLDIAIDPSLMSVDEELHYLVGNFQTGGS